MEWIKRMGGDWKMRQQWAVSAVRITPGYVNVTFIQ